MIERERAPLAVDERPLAVIVRCSSAKLSSANGSSASAAASDDDAAGIALAVRSMAATDSSSVAKLSGTEPSAKPKGPEASGPTASPGSSAIEVDSPVAPRGVLQAPAEAIFAIATMSPMEEAPGSDMAERAEPRAPPPCDARGGGGG